MVLKKIISGGQTGAHQAALVIAKDKGITTGGWAPYEFQTEEGPAPWLSSVYDLEAWPEQGCSYQQRTRSNIVDSTGTVLFGQISTSDGILLEEIAKEHSRPYVVNPKPIDFATWIVQKEIIILNVCGDRASKNPVIYDHVVRVIGETIALLIE